MTEMAAVVLVVAALGVMATVAGDDGVDDTLVVDVGGRAVLDCGNVTGNVRWVFPERQSLQSQTPSLPSSLASLNSHTLPDGGLALDEVSVDDDRSIFTCQDAESNESLHTVMLRVRVPPDAVSNLSVNAHTIFALVTWSPPLPPVKGIAEPLQGYTLQYRPERTSTFHGGQSGQDHEKVTWEALDNIEADATSAEIYRLKANTTYYVRVSAFNSAGASLSVTVSTHTGHDQGEIDEQQREDRRQRGQPTVKIWLVVVGVLLVTFSIIGLGISLLLIRGGDSSCLAVKRATVGGAGVAGAAGSSGETTEEEAMELVPHITLNPSFNIDMLEYLQVSSPDSAAAAQERRRRRRSSQDGQGGGRDQDLLDETTTKATMMTSAR